MALFSHLPPMLLPDNEMFCGKYSNVTFRPATVRFVIMGMVYTCAQPEVFFP